MLSALVSLHNRFTTKLEYEVKRRRLLFTAVGEDVLQVLNLIHTLTRHL